MSCATKFLGFPFWSLKSKPLFIRRGCVYNLITLGFISIERIMGPHGIVRKDILKVNSRRGFHERGT
jgi:hypothetical protein